MQQLYTTLHWALHIHCIQLIKPNLAMYVHASADLWFHFYWLLKIFIYQLRHSGKVTIELPRKQIDHPENGLYPLQWFTYGLLTMAKVSRPPMGVIDGGKVPSQQIASSQMVLRLLILHAKNLVSWPLSPDSKYYFSTTMNCTYTCTW